MTARKITLPCQCAGSCTIAVVAEWDDDADKFPQFAIELYEHVQAQGKLRWRAQIAWQVLRGKEPVTHGLLLSRVQAHMLSDFLAPGGPRHLHTYVDNRCSSCGLVVEAGGVPAA